MTKSSDIEINFPLYIFIYSYQHGAWELLQQNEIWPRDERILRHILLATTTLKRKDVPIKREKGRRIIKHKKGWKPKKKKTV